MKTKKILLFLIGFSCYFTASSQLFFEDFESYNDGDLIVQSSSNWFINEDEPSSTLDTPVSGDQTYSGDLALSFESLSTEIGHDIGLSFNQYYGSGLFTYEMRTYIPSGKAARFDFESSTLYEYWGDPRIVGFDFEPNGMVTLGMYNSLANIVMAFPQDQWFNVKLIANLSLNQWEVFVDGNSTGVFPVDINILGSIKFSKSYNHDYQFYIDDISFSHEEVPLFNLDALILGVHSEQSSALTGRETPIIGEIRNIGENTITSMELSWTDGINTFTDNITGINIPSLTNYELTFSTPYTVLDGLQNISVTIESINGLIDEDLSNNSFNFNVTGYTAAVHRKVLVEEGTGTWCPACPLGDVMIRLMNDEYEDYFVPIAVHFEDPMEIPGYTSDLGITSFPSIAIAREEVFTLQGFSLLDIFRDIESRFFQRIIEVPDAILNATATIDTDNNLTLAAHANFLNDVSGDYKFAMILVEDEVTGTSTDYSQANGYSGNWFAVGGYENLPNPVPAADMVYNHVARVTLGGVSGENNSLPTTINAGDTPSYEFSSIALSSEWELNKMKVVTILLNPDGSVNNVQQEKLSDMITTSVHNDLSQIGTKIYPNPSNGETFIELNLETAQPIKLTVFNVLGERVAFRDYGHLKGNQVLPFMGSNMDNGFYVFQIQIGDFSTTKKVLLSK